MFVFSYNEDQLNRSPTVSNSVENRNFSYRPKLRDLQIKFGLQIGLSLDTHIGK